MHAIIVSETLGLRILGRGALTCLFWWCASASITKIREVVGSGRGLGGDGDANYRIRGLEKMIDRECQLWRWQVIRMWIYGNQSGQKKIRWTRKDEKEWS